MYKDIFKLWLAEQKETSLQFLESNLTEMVGKYIKQLEKAECEIPEIIKAKNERTRYMIRDLIEVRLSKILSMIINGNPIESEALTRQEIDVYEAIKKQIEVGEESEEWLEEVEEELVIVRILVDLPEIVGSDLQVYGPFKAEDVATLPKENAIALIRKGAATLIVTNDKAKK